MGLDGWHACEKMGEIKLSHAGGSKKCTIRGVGCQDERGEAILPSRGERSALGLGWGFVDVRRRDVAFLTWWE